MKTSRLPLVVCFVLLGAGAGCAVPASSVPAKPARTEVSFFEPEKFTDAADGARGSDFGREQILGELRDYLVRKAQAFVPEGQKLSITITDIDLAGEVEPWRSPQLQDVRIIKPIYTPKIDLTFKLTDATGKVLNEGRRQLNDMNFESRLRFDRNDSRVYEKGLLDDWLHREFRPAK